MVNMTPEKAYFKCLHEKRRIPELESIIATDSNYSYWYAFDIIKGRFIEGEKSIATDLDCSYLYARYIIKGRFIEGEKIIANDLDCSYLYARDVIKGPFRLCHPVIFSSHFKDDYIYFLKSINCDLNEISEWLI
jgi:hypothetical protein